MNLPAWITAVATCVMVITVIYYTWYSNKLWKATRDAVRLSAIVFLGARLDWQKRKRMLKVALGEEAEAILKDLGPALQPDPGLPDGAYKM